MGKAIPTHWHCMPRAADVSRSDKATVMEMSGAVFHKAHEPLTIQQVEIDKPEAPSCWCARLLQASAKRSARAGWQRPLPARSRFASR
jgi:hypothetical protein